MITRLPTRLGASKLYRPSTLLARYSAAATAPSPTHRSPPPPPPPRPLPSKLLTPYPPHLVNPPATTRPPPLTIPPPTSPNESTPARLLRLGKGYLSFYKTGLQQIFTNARTADPPPAGSRAHRLFLARYRHDRNLLAPFGLLLLVCGEMTPFVVLLFPRMVPYTCRIPRQMAKLEAGYDRRRRADVARLEGGRSSGAEEAMMVLRTPEWVRGVVEAVGWVPGVEGVLRGRVMRRVRAVMEDDAALRPAGAVEALVGEEVRLAAVERGLVVGGVEEAVLRARLRAWVDCSTDERACFELLLRGEGELVRRGALPEAAWEA